MNSGSSVVLWFCPENWREALPSSVRDMDTFTVYRGIISADKVIAYIGGRLEFEIVQYRGVKNIKEIPLAGISAGFEEMRNSGDILHPADMKAAHDYFAEWYRNP